MWLFSFSGKNHFLTGSPACFLIYNSMIFWYHIPFVIPVSTLSGIILDLGRSVLSFVLHVLDTLTFHKHTKITSLRNTWCLGNSEFGAQVWHNAFHKPKCLLSYLTASRPQRNISFQPLPYIFEWKGNYVQIVWRFVNNAAADVKKVCFWIKEGFEQFKLLDKRGKITINLFREQ